MCRFLELSAVLWYKRDMNYIVFDLEWNQCPYGKAMENAQLPFEIIEIGAVKLNEKKEILSSYHQYIRPVIYRQIHFRTKEVIGITMDDLKEGMLFHDAASDFFKWCGTGFRFCTWGTLDLFELQRNLKYYYLSELLTAPVFYEDVQKLFALSYENPKERRSLSYAADFLKISSEGDFHHALDDAMYTARIFQTLSDDVILGNYSIDYYQNPKSRDEEIRIRYDSYEKYVTREFDTKEDAMEDRELTSMRCFVCHQNVKRKIKWFSNNSKNQYAVASCPEHGYVKGKIRLKTAEDGKIFAVKTTKMISEEEVEEISKKQSFLRLKRQKKRKK